MKKKNTNLQSHTFTLVMFWLGRPPQESTDIFSNLAHGGRGSYGGEVSN